MLVQPFSSSAQWGCLTQTSHGALLLTQGSILKTAIRTTFSTKLLTFGDMDRSEPIRTDQVISLRASAACDGMPMAIKPRNAALFQP